MEVKELEQIPTKTFKEVHEELEMECTFLTKNHNIADFKQKSEFLNSSGFHNSIATRLYGAIADSVDVVRDISSKYHGQHKFILEPQLERVCEKYNLYVRDVSLFIGDIPEKNIKDIMNFKIFISDLPDRFVQIVKGNPVKEEKKAGDIHSLIASSSYSRRVEDIEHYTAMFNRPNSDNLKLSLREIGEIESKIATHMARNGGRRFYAPVLDIAAIKNLLAPSAFTETQARIINFQPEAVARFQVNLDPIVLCNTKHKGRLIVTAWGDESNDELVANQNRN